MLEFLFIFLSIFTSAIAFLCSCAACRVAVMNREKTEKEVESLANQVVLLRANIADLRITVKERREQLERLMN